MHSNEIPLKQQIARHVIWVLHESRHGTQVSAFRVIELTFKFENANENFEFAKMMKCPRSSLSKILQ